MGRKPLADTAKSGMFYIRVTTEERAELDTAASAAGVPTSTWARDLLLSAARAPVAAVPKKTRTKPKT